MKLADDTSKLQAVAARRQAARAAARLHRPGAFGGGGLRGTSPWLEARFDEAADAAEAPGWVM
jgi:hypothetical protein